MKFLAKRILWIALFYGVANSKAVAAEHNLLTEKAVEWPLRGNATNGLLPCFAFQKLNNDWTVEIDYAAQKDFAHHSWLKITNRVGARLQLLSTNGFAVKSVNADALTVTNLPRLTSIKDVMQSVPHRQQGYQWLHTEVGNPMFAASFRLKNIYNVSFTNDYVLKIAPLIYRVQTNGDQVYLTEFPPSTFLLRFNGSVEKVLDSR